MADPLLPPWKKYPKLGQGMGWRMGYGEDYLTEFDRWFSALARDQSALFQKDNPAPIWWRDFYERYQREDG